VNLRRLSNEEFEEASARAHAIPLDECPACGSKVIQTGDPDTWGRQSGAYRYKGQVHDCDCETQINLRKHYLVANIPDQFQRLNWNDYRGSEKMRDSVAVYLDKWAAIRRNGMGIEFNGKTLGTGKTFAATHVAKELVKKREKVFFIPFKELISSYKRSDAEEFEKRLKDVTVLALDEVVGPTSDAQGSLFSNQFEELIRHRTNYNLPTIMTTNLSSEELLKAYPRPYSLLEAKQIRVKVDGSDARMGWIGEENLELVSNDEVRPIT
jgi:DNA replication protein DnaC